MNTPARRPAWIRWPLFALQFLWTVYLALIAALTVLCFVGVGIVLVRYWLGLPV